MQPGNGVDSTLILFVSNAARMDTLPGIAGRRTTHLSRETHHMVNYTLTRSQVTGGDNNGSNMDMSTVYEKGVGECPVVTVRLGGVDVPCLLDLGSEVSTITEEFFMNSFAPKGKLFHLLAIG